MKRARVWLLVWMVALATACASQTICDYVVCVEGAGGEVAGGGGAGGSGGAGGEGGAP